MSFFRNILIAIVSLINPILGVIGSVIEYVTSSSIHSGKLLLLNLASSFITLPNIASGFIKDVATGMISDIVEINSLSNAVDETVPVNSITLKCDCCSTYTNRYVVNDGVIKCKKCVLRKLDHSINFDNKIYILENNIYRLNKKIVTFERLDESSRFNRVNSTTSFKRIKK